MGALAVKEKLASGPQNFPATTSAWAISPLVAESLKKTTAANDDTASDPSLDEETGLYYFGARYYDPRTSVWQSGDPILGEYLDGEHKGGVYNSLNLGLYSYAYQNPVKYTDPDGKAVETPWDAFNVALGVASFADNISEGNYWSAALDGAGVVYDVFATAVTVLPGGAGAAIKAGRAADSGIDALKAGDAAKAGGAYKDLKATKGATEAHHLPSRDSLKKSGTDKVSVNSGPSVIMDIRDHRKTSSHGSKGRASVDYRTEVADKIKDGDWRGAMAQEVRDVRNAAHKGSGDRTKYNQGLREALQHAKDQGLLDR